MLNLSSFFIERELRKRGYEVRSFYDNDLLLLEKNGKHFFTHSSITLQKATSYLICRDKFLSKEVLSHFGLPTTRGVILTRNTILESLSLEFPLALKPLNLSGGVGIALNISTTEEIENYFRAHPEFEKILAEEMLRGEDTRILIVRGKFFAASQREPASVLGDGTHTLGDLIRKENESREQSQKRQHDQNVWDEDIFPILVDADLELFLVKDGKDLSYIPASGEKVFVRPNANVASGGVSVDVTQLVCKEIRAMAERVASCLNMTTIGIDLMSSNLHEPLEKQQFAGIVEVNASPGLSLHVLAKIGVRHDPTRQIVDEIEEHISLCDREGISP